MVLTIADAAWAAGIIDGEGSIFIMKQKRKDRERTHNFILRVSVQSADRVMAPELKRLFPEGAEFGMQLDSRPGHSACLKWQVAGKRAIRVLKEILPYLRVKKDQAEAAIEFQETTKKHWRHMVVEDYQNQEDFYYKLKQLKIDAKLGKDTKEYAANNQVVKIESDLRAVS